MIQTISLSFLPAYYSTAALQTEVTVGSPINRILPVMNIVAQGVLSFFMLVPGSSGSVTPNDYNSLTNPVSWKQVL